MFHEEYFESNPLNYFYLTKSLVYVILFSMILLALILCSSISHTLIAIKGMVFTPMVVGAPVVFICACVFTTYILGKSALIGMLVYALTYIAQVSTNDNYHSCHL